MRRFFIVTPTMGGQSLDLNVQSRAAYPIDDIISISLIKLPHWDDRYMMQVSMPDIEGDDFYTLSIAQWKEAAELCRLVGATDLLSRYTPVVSEGNGLTYIGELK